MESGIWVIWAINGKQYAQSSALPPIGYTTALYYFQNRVRNVTMFCRDTHTHTHTHYTVPMM